MKTEESKQNSVNGKQNAYRNMMSAVIYAYIKKSQKKKKKKKKKL